MGIFESRGITTKYNNIIATYKQPDKLIELLKGSNFCFVCKQANAKYFVFFSCNWKLEHVTQLC